MLPPGAVISGLILRSGVGPQDEKYESLPADGFSKGISFIKISTVNLIDILLALLILLNVLRLILTTVMLPASSPRLIFLPILSASDSGL